MKEYKLPFVQKKSFNYLLNKINHNYLYNNDELIRGDAGKYRRSDREIRSEREIRSLMILSLSLVIECVSPELFFY